MKSVIAYNRNSTKREIQIGRLKNNTSLVCLHNHFTYEERMQLKFYHEEKDRFPKITSKIIPGTLLHKHPKTITGEIQRGQVKHCFYEELQKKIVYNADNAEHQARAKDSDKSLQLRLGYDYVLAQAIRELVKEKKYSPYAVLTEFNNSGWPTKTRINEKTLYNFVYERLIPNINAKNPLLQGKDRKKTAKLLMRLRL